MSLGCSGFNAFTVIVAECLYMYAVRALHWSKTGKALKPWVCKLKINKPEKKYLQFSSLFKYLVYIIHFCQFTL